jgi:ankyrin repeat protein
MIESIDPFLVVSNGDLEGVIKFCENGENVNRVRWSGFALLHRAAQLGYTDICQVLVVHGADLDMRTTKGWYTPLHLALGNGYLDTAQFLLNNGAKPWIKCKSKEDPFDYGTKKGYKAMCVDLRASMVKMEMALAVQRNSKIATTR